MNGYDDWSVNDGGGDVATADEIDLGLGELPPWTPPKPEITDPRLKSRLDQYSDDPVAQGLEMLDYYEESGRAAAEKRRASEKSITDQYKDDPVAAGLALLDYRDRERIRSDIEQRQAKLDEADRQKRIQSYADTYSGTGWSLLDEPKEASARAGGTLVSLAARLGEVFAPTGLPVGKQAADEINRMVDEWAEAQDINRQRSWSPGLSRFGGNLAQSGIEMLANPGGTTAKVIGAGLSTGNRAATTGYDAGLRGGRLAQYVAEQAAPEMLVGTFLNKIGLGGAESVASGELTPQSFRQLMREFLKQSGAEALEEGTTQALQDLSNKFSVDPNLTLNEALWNLAEAAASGAALTGVMSVPNVARVAMTPAAQRAEANKQERIQREAQAEKAFLESEQPSRRQYDKLSDQLKATYPLPGKVSGLSERRAIQAAMRADREKEIAAAAEEGTAQAAGAVAPEGDVSPAIERTVIPSGEEMQAEAERQGQVVPADEQPELSDEEIAASIEAAMGALPDEAGVEAMPTTADSLPAGPAPESVPVDTGEALSAGQAPVSTPTASVPMMVTREMRAQLRDRGFTKSQIDVMTPESAWSILNAPAVSVTSSSPQTFVPDSIAIKKNGKILRVTVSQSRNKDGTWDVTKVKLHDDDSGSYQVVDFPEDVAKGYDNPDDARQEIFNFLSEKYPLTKSFSGGLPLIEQAETTSSSPQTGKRKMRIDGVEQEIDVPADVLPAFDRLQAEVDKLRGKNDAASRAARLDLRDQQRELIDQFSTGVSAFDEARRAFADQLKEQKHAAIQGQQPKVDQPQHLGVGPQRTLPEAGGRDQPERGGQEPQAKAPEVGVRPEVAKEPWQMTRKEWSKYHFDEESDRYLPSSYFDDHSFSAKIEDTTPIKTLSSGIEIRQGKYGIVYAFDGSRNVGMGDGKAYVVDPEYQFRGIGSALMDATYTGRPIGSRTSAGASLIASYHRQQVEKAIREGKPVPAEVLAEYPDLQPKPTGPVSELLAEPVKPVEIGKKPRKQKPKAASPADSPVSKALGEPSPAQQPQADTAKPYSKESLAEAFNLDDEQATALDALIQSMGLDTSNLSVAKGGTPGSGALFMPAWHGSPHRFDKFSLQKIGTGEGNQAYGWGMYFTSKREVAEWYRDNLSDKRQVGFGVLVDGKELRLADDSLSPDVSFARDLVFDLGSADAAKEWLKQALGADYDSGIKRTISTRQSYQRTLAILGKWKNVSVQKGNKTLYKVDIAPRADEMLDWDKSSSSQSKHVLDTIKREFPGFEMLVNAVTVGDKTFDIDSVGNTPEFYAAGYLSASEGDYEYAIDEARSSALSAEIHAEGFDPGDKDREYHLDAARFASAVVHVLEDWASRDLPVNVTKADFLTGQDIYRRLVDVFESDGSKTPEKAASEYLRSIGIRGITYIGTESGARNYVLFDDKDVRIEEVLFQGEKGSAEFTSDGKAIIRGLQSPDISTGVHEVAHVARRWLLNKDVRPELRNGITDADIDVVEKWAGVKDGKWTTAAEEKFARGLESYIRTGSTPLNSKIAAVLSKIADWMRKIYATIKGSPVDVKISKPMKAVFDKLLTRGEPVASASPPAAASPQKTAVSEQPAAKPSLGEMSRDQLVQMASQGQSVEAAPEAPKKAARKARMKKPKEAKPAEAATPIEKPAVKEKTAREKAAEKSAKSIAKFARLARNELGSTGGVSPELMSAAIEMTVDLVQEGYHTFREFVQRVADAIGVDLARKAGRVLEKAWTNIREGTSGHTMDAASSVDDILADVRPQIDLRDHFAEQLATGKKYGSINEARAEANDLTGTKKYTTGTPEAKKLDETIETAVVQAARKIVAESKGDARQTFDQLVDLYERQPMLGVRTSTSMINQAYSTPAPLAYLTAELAGITPNSTVYEPTAGNGMLLITANPSNATANEIDPSRAQALKDQGFSVTENDATQYVPDSQFGAIVANPPFGTQPGKTFDVDGFKTRERDQAIVMQALKTLSPDGTAVVIIGAKGLNIKEDVDQRAAYLKSGIRPFYQRLYDSWEVADHFKVSGDLYARQGASFPVEVLVIKPRGTLASDERRAYPWAVAPRMFESWQELGDAKLRMAARHEAAVGVRAGERGDGSAVVSGRPEGVDVGRVPRPAAVEGEVAGTERGRAEPEPSVREGVVQPSGPVSEPADERARPGAGLRGDIEAERGGGKPVPAEAGEPARRGRVGAAPVSGSVVPATTAEQGQVEESFQSDYVPRSKGTPNNTLSPVNMTDAVQRALDAVEDAHGDLDAYVAKSLGMDDASLKKAFFAEQIDALAMAIHNDQRGDGFVLGDQTGIGKGRVVAGMMRYAMQTGRLPVFVTEKPDLYADMVRDLIGIGASTQDAPFNPLITNDTSSSDKVIVLPDGREIKVNRKVREGQMSAAVNSLLGGGDFAAADEKFNAVFTNYSQLQTQSGDTTWRREQIARLLPKAFFVFDESHNAGGSTTGEDWSKAGATPKMSELLRQWVQQASGVMYSSGTWARRADVMDLYSRTGMIKAVAGDATKLPAAIKAGGVPLQQIVSSMLAEAGQLVRRERDFKGISFPTNTVAVDLQEQDHITGIYRAIRAFDKVVGSVVQDIRDEMVAAGEDLQQSMTADKDIKSTNFSSLIWSAVDQMLLALKSDQAAQSAVAAWKRGEQVVVAVDNTLEELLQEYVQQRGLKPGDVVDLNFRDVMMRFIERSRMVTIKYGMDDRGNPKTRKERLTDEQLDVDTKWGNALNMFNAMKAQVEDIDIKAPASPIDWMRFKMSQAGMSVAEITGRKLILEYQPDGTARLAKRDPNEKGGRGKQNTIAGFNKGTLDAVLLNRSGSTGISLHAQKPDSKKRHMIIAQAAKNIDEFMQILGRINRTGQTKLPSFELFVSDSPSESRPAAVLSKKLASLNANVTAKAKGVVSFDVPDVMNQVGGDVIMDFLIEHPDIADELENTGLKGDGGPSDYEEFARDVTGKVAILPVSQQQEFWDSVSKRYLRRIDELNATNENPLIAQSLDMQAKTLAKAVLFAGDPEAGPFGAPAYIEQVDAKVLGKPMKPEDVADHILSFYKADSLDGLFREGSKWNKSMNEEIGQKVEDFKAFIKATPTLSEEELAKRMATIDDNFQKLRTAMSSFYPGSPVEVGGDMQGIVIGFQRSPGKHINPVAGSTWEIKVAVTNALRQVTVPVSGIERMKLVERVASVDGAIEEFKSAQSVVREKRWIGTGNLLAAFADLNKANGKLVFYTNDSGETQRGVLMPRKFDARSYLEEQPITFDKVDDVVSYFKRGGTELETPDGILKLSYVGGRLAFVAPRAAARGGKWTKNRDFLEATSPYEFVSSGNRMEMVISDLPTAKKAIQFVIDNGTLQATKDRDLARDVLGVQEVPVTATEQAAADVKETAAELAAEIDKKLKGKAFDITGVAATAFDPKLWALTTKLAYRVAKLGTLKFADYVAAATKGFNAATKNKMMPMLRAAWEDVRGKNPDLKMESIEPEKPKAEAAGPTVPPVAVPPAEKIPEVNQDAPDRQPTAIHKAALELIAARLNLKKPRGLPPDSMKSVFQQASDELARNPGWIDELHAKIVENGGAMNHVEMAAMDIHERVLVSQVEDRFAAADAAEKSGDKLTAAAQNKLAQLASVQLDDHQQIVRKAGSIWGKTGNVMQQYLRDDFAPEALIRKRRVAKGKALLEKEIASATKQANEAKAGQEREEQVTREAKAKQTVEQMAKSAGRKVRVDQAHKASQAARKKLREMLKTTAKLSSAEKNVARDWIQAERQSGVATWAAFKKRAATDGYGIGAKNFAKEESDLKEIWDSTAGDLSKQIGVELKEAVAQSKVDSQADDADQAGISEALNSLIHFKAKQMARQLIESGVTDWRDIVDAVEAEFSKHIEGFGRNEAMDAISDYGTSTPAATDFVSRTMSGIRSILQKTRQLTDIVTTGTAKATGQQRLPPDAESRQLTREINDAKKKYGIVDESPDSPHTQTAVESRIRALENQIEDLQNEIDTGKRIERDKGRPVTNERIRELEAERDEKRRQRDALLLDPLLLKEAEAKAITAAEEAERRVRDLELERKKPVSGKPKLTSEIIESANRQREAALAEMRRLRAIRAKWERAENAPTEAERELARKLRQEKRELEKAMREPEKLKALEDKANKEADEAERRLRDLEFDVANPTSGKPRPTSAEIESARNRRDAALAEIKRLKAIREQWRRAELTKSDEEQQQSRMEREAERQLEWYKKALSSETVAGKKQATTIPKTERTLRLEAEAAALKAEYDYMVAWRKWGEKQQITPEQAEARRQELGQKNGIRRLLKRLMELQNELSRLKRERTIIAKAPRSPITPTTEMVEARAANDKLRAEIEKTTEDIRREQRKWPQVAWDEVKTWLNDIPRTLRLFWDASVFGVQTITGTLNPFKAAGTAKAIGAFMRSLMSEKGRAEAILHFENMPWARKGYFQRLGIDPRADISEEEGKRINLTWRSIPAGILGGAAVAAFTPIGIPVAAGAAIGGAGALAIKAFNRANSIALAYLKARDADLYLRAAPKDENGNISETDLDLIANAVNVGAGKGFKIKSGEVSSVLTGVFLAPNYHASRIKTALLEPLWHVPTKRDGESRWSPKLRATIGFHSYIGPALGVAAAVAIADAINRAFDDDEDKDKPTFNTDINSKDFGAIRILKHKVNPLRQILGLYALGHQLWTGEQTDRYGKKRDKSRWAIIGEWGRGKLNITPGIAADLWHGATTKRDKGYATHIGGQEMTPESIAAKVGSAYFALSYEGYVKALQENGVPAKVAVALGTFIGNNVDPIIRESDFYKPFGDKSDDFWATKLILQHNAKTTDEKDKLSPTLGEAKFRVGDDLVVNMDFKQTQEYRKLAGEYARRAVEERRKLAAKAGRKPTIEDVKAAIERGRSEAKAEVDDAYFGGLESPPKAWKLNVISRARSLLSTESDIEVRKGPHKGQLRSEYIEGSDNDVSIQSARRALKRMSLSADDVDDLLRELWGSRYGTDGMEDRPARKLKSGESSKDVPKMRVNTPAYQQSLSRLLDLVAE